MKNKTVAAVWALNLFFLSSTAGAAGTEIPVDDTRNTGMAISIYNNNLGFVKDTRKIALPQGNSSIAFEGVAATMQPETAMVVGDDIVVVEQNYDYDLLTPDNLLEKSVGQTVKTAVFDEESGKDIYGRAKILSNSYGRPVLEFDYGVETNFPGRLIYEKLPESLRVKPTLVVNLNNKTAGEKSLELGYLAQGISWRADYIAEVKGKDILNLNTWITLNNATGTDYTDATVQLVSGSVNQAVSTAAGVVRPRMMMAKSAMYDGAAVMNETAEVSRSSLSDYYLYTLPVKTTIKDKQSKQVSLMSQENVKFEKEYRMTSPLYVGVNSRANEFNKLNPSVVFKLNNEKESNLGEPLPAGVVRFYQNDDGGNLQFIGESNIEHSAVGEKIDLTIGRAFDVYAKGKIVSVNQISKDMSEVSAEITFSNATDEAKKLIFEQAMGDRWEILSENVAGEVKNADVAKWQVEIPANGKFVLSYKVRVSRNK